MKLSDANKVLGFWERCGLIDLDRGNLWPREYRWQCGCLGVSMDGADVQVAACGEHLQLIGTPRTMEVEDIRAMAMGRRELGYLQGQVRVPAGDGVPASTRSVFVDFFEERRRGRSRKQRKSS